MMRRIQNKPIAKIPTNSHLGNMIGFAVLLIFFSMVSAQIPEHDIETMDLLEENPFQDDTRDNMNATDTRALRSGVFNYESAALQVAGKTFYFFTAWKVDWYNATRQCLKRGLRLATIADFDEDRMVIDFITKKQWIDYRFWVGATDMGADRPTEYYWTSNGRDVRRGFVNWAPGEPNNGLEPQNEHCVEINFQEKWNDYICTESTNLFICEDIPCDESCTSK